MSRFLNLLQSRPAYLAAVAVVALLSTTLAIVFSYISPDSWYYILVAQALRHGQGCALDGDYLAVYPCGYPTVLALTAPVADLATFMVSSKIANLLLLIGSFICIWRGSKSLLAATVVAINPVTLLIFMYTWSENLELLCISGAYYALARLDAHENRDRRDYALLAVCLITGCFTRYFFGPYAFLLFVCAWLSFGGRLALKALPVFVAAGVIYLAYQAFNWHETGFTTGMPRSPAPESLYLIVKNFAVAAWTNGFSVFTAVVLLLGLSYRLVAYGKGGFAGLPSGKAAAMCLVYAGIAFLALAFWLRARTFFDPYDTRTIGFGVVFIAAGLTARFARLRDNSRWPAWAVLASGLFSAVYADGDSIPDGVRNLMRGQWQFGPAHVADLQYDGPDADFMVTFDIPALDDRLWNVENVRHIYYGDGPEMISPQIGPDVTPDTPKTFLAKLDDVGKQSCYFDFTPFATVDDFRDYLGSTTQIDESFTPFGTPTVTSKPNFDPALQRYLLAIVQPGKLVPCADILKLPATRAVLNGGSGNLAMAEQARRIFLNH